MTLPLVSIILAPHNGMDHISACLESIQKSSFRGFEVIVVDNASTDGTAEFVRQHYPSTTVIESARNLAYAEGNNLGAASARGTYLLFLNHDTTVHTGFLEALVRVLEAGPEIGIAQSRIMMAASPDLVDSIGAYLTRTGIWVHPLRGQVFRNDPSDPVDILGAAGACLMVRRNVFSRLGGFDPDFVIYFEDADLSLRVRNLGYRVVVVPTSVVLHWGGSTTGRMPSNFTVFHSFKNRLCLMVKNLGLGDLILGLPIHIALCLLGAAAYLARFKPRSSAAIVSALIWNARNLGSTLQKRRTVESERSVDSHEAYKALLKPLPLQYFIRTSLSYLSRW